MNGYYRARVIRDGSVLGSWSSIPVNGGYQVAAELPVGGKARVIGSSPLSTPDIVGSWAYVGTDMVETISRNLVAAILQEGVVDSATAALIVSEFTAIWRPASATASGLRSGVSILTARLRTRTVRAPGPITGTWSVSGNTLTIIEKDGLVLEGSVDVDGDNLTLTLTREQYMRIVLQAAGELNEEDREFFDAMLKGGRRDPVLLRSPIACRRRQIAEPGGSRRVVHASGRPVQNCAGSGNIAPASGEVFVEADPPSRRTTAGRLE